MSEIKEIIESDLLEYFEKKDFLANSAESQMPYVEISEKAKDFLNRKIICDIMEGNAPYRPRYVLPDYNKFLQNGSEYLNIKKPENFYQAINALLIIYQYVPSITGTPVYLGNLDDLLEPYVDGVSQSELENLLEMYLNFIDRTMANGFVHLNIGPKDTRVGRCLFKLYRKLGNAIPNLSFKYRNDTPDDMLLDAVKTALEVSAPYIVNDETICNQIGENYGIASCFNTLKVGGGSHTLVRLDLKRLSIESINVEDFISNKLPEAVSVLSEVINARAKYLVEKSKFYESTFLVREGLIDISNFTSMAGVFALYECVEQLLDGKTMENSEEALMLGERVINEFYKLIKNEDGLYCDGYGGKIGVHAQSGLDFDVGVTAGVRYKAGNEPELFKQITSQSKLHKYFDAGVSDIYVFDKTAKNNPEGVAQIIKGAMKKGVKLFSLCSSDSDLIRVTGYLIKKSDFEKYEEGKPTRESTVVLGSRSIKNLGLLNRRVKSI